MNKEAFVAIGVVTALLVGGVLGATFATWSSNSDLADVVTAVVASLALIVAVATVLQSHDVGLAQRQTEAMHRLDNEFDKIRFDIEERHGDIASEKGAVTEAQENLYYRRFFIALENCQRCYRRGLVPRSEYVNWSCSLVSRFGTHTKLVLHPSAQVTYEAAWNDHRAYSLGDKRDFNAYIDAIIGLSQAEPWAKAKEVAARTKAPHTKPVALTDEQHEQLKKDCEALVDKLKLVTS